MRERLSYFLLRCATLPFAFMPYSWIHFLGKILGLCAYFMLSKFRKRTWSNLALAKELGLNNSQIRSIAKKSFQNLMITCLEYPRLAREKKIANIATCENPRVANQLMEKGKGVIFFCGHQANWELLFLEGTSRMPGVAIGRPLKNQLLYRWILNIRQKFGGLMIPPKNAIKEGLRALKKGAFLGIVGDQGMPGSGYSSSFLGRNAWTSPIPAMLAYRTNTPLLVATTVRKEGKYHIHYSDPIFPNETSSMEEEVPRMMDAALHLFQQSIKKHPEQWLWQHNRWKQQSLDVIKRAFRHDALAIFVPEDDQLLKDLTIFREIYPTEFIAAFIPSSLKDQCTLDAEIHTYNNVKEMLLEDFRFKLIFNLTKHKEINRHYKKLSALHTISLEPKNLKDILKPLITHAGK